MLSIASNSKSSLNKLWSTSAPSISQYPSTVVSIRHSSLPTGYFALISSHDDAWNFVANHVSDCCRYGSSRSLNNCTINCASACVGIDTLISYPLRIDFAFAHQYNICPMLIAYLTSDDGRRTTDPRRKHESTKQLEPWR